MVLGRVFRAVVGHDVDEHVTGPILTAPLRGHERLHAEPDNVQVLDAVVGRVEATDKLEASALVQLAADRFQERTERGKQEVAGADLGSVQTQGYARGRPRLGLVNKAVIPPP